MLPLLFFLVCLASVPLAGGRLGALGNLQFRRSWSIFAALGLQLLIISVFPDRMPGLHPYLHLFSYVLGALFIFSNLHVPGVWMIGLGGAMNLLAIAANGGTMPASSSALETAGLLAEEPGTFLNSTALSDPNLAFLGDIFATPSSWPFANVFSLGDIAMALGAALGVHRVCGSRLVPSARGEMAAAVRVPAFRRLLIGQAASNLGDFMYALAVVVSLADSGVDAHVFATLLIVQVAPAAVTGFLGGPLIDRLPRRRLMIGADAARAVAVGSLLVAGDPSLAHFYVVAACLGGFGALFQPGLQASLPTIVPKRLLVAANSMVTGTYHLAVMLGPLLGGVVAAKVGASPAFAFNVATFLLSAALLLTVRIPHTRAEHPAPTARALLEGIRYSLGNRLVRGVLVVAGLAMLAGASISPLEPVFILRTLDGEPQDLGLVEGAWGFGMLLGSIAAPAAARRWHRLRLMTVGVATLGVCVATASRSTTLFPLLLLWIVSGAGNAMITISYESLLQERTPDRLRGRVLASSEAVFDSAFIAGALTAGVVGTAIGVRAAWLVAGSIFLVAAAIGHLILSPSDFPAQEDPEGADGRPLPATASGSGSGGAESPLAPAPAPAFLVSGPVPALSTPAPTRSAGALPAGAGDPPVGGPGGPPGGALGGPATAGPGGPDTGRRS